MSGAGSAGARSAAGGGSTGQQRAASGFGDLNATTFLMQQMLARIATVTLVRVKAVTNVGGVAPVGFVDVQPMVAQLDGAGDAVPHGVIHNVPYFRLQGGRNAVILDPEVGDIGIAGFASRDISAVKASKAPANPGSMRRFDHADALYWGGVLNAAPEQFVAFSKTGIAVVSPTKVTIKAPNTEVQGDMHVTGNTRIDGTTTGDGAGVFQRTDVHTHVHSNSGGNGVGGPPVV